MSSIFVRSKKWKSHDVFARQKSSAFKSSRPAVMELAARYNEVITQLDSKKSSAAERTPAEDEKAELLLFKEMCEICLWGNATDLSLLTSLTYDDIQKLQGSEARKKAEKNIVVDELTAALDTLKSAQKTVPDKDRRVDIILDNSGFELFVDLVLAGYLLVANLATTVVLHPKSIPWFVSDVLPADFLTLMNALADPQSFFQTHRDEAHLDGPELPPLSHKNLEDVSSLFRHWSDFHQNGQLVIRPNRFWTQAGGYDRLATAGPRLFEDLQGSELVIFKGDLNYRKLTGDVSAQKSGVRSLD